MPFVDRLRRAAYPDGTGRHMSPLVVTTRQGTCVSRSVRDPIPSHYINRFRWNALARLRAAASFTPRRRSSTYR